MFIEYQNAKIHFHICGNGFPLVLLHGFLQSSSHWNSILPLLSKKNKVILIDLPGHGKSEVVNMVHSMELMADVVYAIIDKLSIYKANFMGHSMGGYIILAMVEKYPTIINSMVLLNSTPLKDTLERKKNRDKAISIIDNNSDIYITRAIKALFTEKDQTKFSKEIKVLTRAALQFPINGITAALKGMKERKEKIDVLKNFTGGKFLIYGKKDPLLAHNEIKTVTKLSNTWLFQVNSGHMSILENKEEIITILHFIDFL